MIWRAREYHNPEKQNPQLHLHTLPCSQELLLDPVQSQVKRLLPSDSHHPIIGVTSPPHWFPYLRHVLITAQAAVDRMDEQKTSDDITHTCVHGHPIVHSKGPSRL